jgi:hypothetical protein
MPVVSVTRLHLRSLRYLAPFIVDAMRATRQARRSSGFGAGWLGNEGLHGFWTATTWASLDAMRDYRNSPPHRQSMKKLLHWCDTASYVHWDQDGTSPPDAGMAFTRLSAEGTLSKVLHPSDDHRASRTTGTTRPRPGRPFGPT